jgi:hypothetical protein
LAGAGLQIIFEYSDGRPAGVNHAKVINGAGHFTKTAAAALLGIDFEPYFHCCLIAGLMVQSSPFWVVSRVNFHYIRCYLFKSISPQILALSAEFYNP